MPSGAPGKSKATIGTSYGSNLEPSCIVLPAPTIPLAPEITTHPRASSGPKIRSTSVAVSAGSAPFLKMSITPPRPSVSRVGCRMV